MSEEGRLEGDEARLRLYEAMRADCSSDERIERALEIGADYFGVEYGYVAEIDRSADEWSVVVSTDDDGEMVPEGLQAALSSTYCQRTVREEAVVAVVDTSEGEWEWDVGAFAETSCYHGAPVMVEGEVAATACFVSSAARSEPFTEAERAFADLVATMVGTEFERRRRESELAAREHELDERREIYRATIDASFDMVFRVDTDGIYTYHSPAVERLLGYAPSELVGEQYGQLLATEAAVEAAHEIFRRVLAGETVHEQYLPMEAADGSLVYADVNATPVYDCDVPIDERTPADIVAVQGVAHDATDRKRRERLIRVLNRVLRHNLRNDMTVVGGLSETLERRLDGDNREAATRIRRTSDRLLELGETARRLEENVESMPPLETTDIVPLVTDVVSGVRQRYPEASVEVDVPERALARTAPRLRTALWELVDNAAQHGGPQPSVEVSVTVEESTVRIAVDDDGPGLPPAERSVLVSGDESPLVHGTGLGLWLVYWIVTGLDGALTVPQSGDGTRIELSLPRADGE